MRQAIYPGMIVIMLCGLIGVMPAWGQQQVALDYIVAVIDNDVILKSDVMQATQMYLLQTQERPSPGALRSLQTRFLKEMINNRIIIAAARRDSVEVPGDQVDNAVRRTTDQMIEQWGSQEALAQALAREGFSMRDYLRLLRQQEEEKLLQRRLEEERFGAIRVTGQEVEAYYNAHKDSLPEKPVIVEISHIMMTAHPDPEQEAKRRQRIEEIRALIQNGADFAEMARQYSEDLATAPRGGDLGLFSRGTFIQEFEEAAFRLQPGEMSDVVKTPYGFHLIKMEERQESAVRVRHILIQSPTTPEDEQRAIQTLTFLRERIVNGDETFKEAAKKYSEDIESSLNGGSLGEFRLDALQPQYRAEVENLKAGEISMPIKVTDVENTFHLIRLDARRGGGRLNLKEDWDAVANLAKQHKWETIRQQWIDDMRQELYIEVRGLDETG